MPDCVFCRIMAGELPGSFVYRDERTVAFMDIQPVNRGHVLVVPVQHVPSLTDLDSDVAAALMRVAHGMTGALQSSSVRCEGVNLFLADGEAAGQEVFHVHLHVIPRFRGDGFGLRFGPEYSKRPPRTDLEVVAAELRGLLGRS